MLTAITTVVVAVTSALVTQGIDFGIVFSGVLLGLSVVFEVSDFGKEERVKSVKNAFSTHIKIFALMFFVFFALKMLSFV